MKRDIKKVLEEFEILNHKKRGGVAIFQSDILSITNNIKTKYNKYLLNGLVADIMYDCIIISLKYGYVLGYRIAKQDKRKRGIKPCY